MMLRASCKRVCLPVKEKQTCRELLMSVRKPLQPHSNVPNIRQAPVVSRSQQITVVCRTNIGTDTEAMQASADIQLIFKDSVKKPSVWVLRKKSFLPDVDPWAHHLVKLLFQMQTDSPVITLVIQWKFCQWEILHRSLCCRVNSEWFCCPVECGLILELYLNVRPAFFISTLPQMQTHDLLYYWCPWVPPLSAADLIIIPLHRSWRTWSQTEVTVRDCCCIHGNKAASVSLENTCVEWVECSVNVEICRNQDE